MSTGLRVKPVSVPPFTEHELSRKVTPVAVNLPLAATVTRLVADVAEPLLDGRPHLLLDPRLHRVVRGGGVALHGQSQQGSLIWSPPPFHTGRAHPFV